MIHLKIKRFLYITFAFSWIVWFPGVLNNFNIIKCPVPDQVLVLFGALSPFLATFYLEFKADGLNGLKSILNRSFNPNIKWQWLTTIILLPLLMHGISRFLFSLQSPDLPESDVVSNPVNAFIAFMVMFTIGGGLNEEIGWRNYVLEYYQTKYNALQSSLILSLYWIIWHLPLFFMDSTNQAHLPFYLFALTVVPFTIMLTWIYNNTNGSIFAVALFHTMGNFSHEIFKVVPTKEATSLFGFYTLTAVYIISCIIILFSFGYMQLRQNIY